MDTADGASRRLGRRLRVVASVVAATAVMAASVGGLGALAVSWHRTAPSAAMTPGIPSEGFSVWERNDDGTPVRWDPCSRIELVLATAGLPDGAAEELDHAVETLRDASGLDLVVTRTTDERPSAARLPYQPEIHGERWSPVLVAWASADEDLPMRDTDRGVAVPIAVGPAGDRTYVSGQVVLNADRDDLNPGTQDRADSRGATLLHELIHLLGLGHVDDPDELMFVHPGEGPVVLGGGDRAGLRAVGAEGGCRDVPTPRPVEVAGLPGR